MIPRSLRQHHCDTRRGPGAVVRACCRSRSANGRALRFDLRPDRCPTARRSHDDSGCDRREAQTGAAGEFAFQDLPEGDYEISAELSGFERARRDRARAGGRTGHRVPHLAGRHRGRNVRHGREGGRARCSDDSHGDQCHLRLRARAPGHADTVRCRCARTLRHAFSEHRLQPTHHSRDRGECGDRRLGSKFGDVPRRRLPRSAGDGVRAVSSISIASKCCADRRAPCTDATRLAARST